MTYSRRVWLFMVVAVIGHASSGWGQTAPIRLAAPATQSISIPIFPLLDVVLFPNMSRPLQIFEPRYREMVADAVRGDGLIGMVLLQPGYASLYEGNPEIFDIGCVGEITDAEELPDGRWVIVLRGTTRFRILAEDQSRSYRIAEVEVLDEQLDAAQQVTLGELRAELSDLFMELGLSAEPPPDDLPDEDLVNGLAQFLELAPSERQRLIETGGPLERAQALLEMLR